jgi:hypothetical protein
MQRKVKLQGTKRVGDLFILGMAACDLIRIPKRLASTP